MNKLLLGAAAAAFLAGCSGSGRVADQSLSGEQAVSHDARTYVLGKVPDQEREQAFQELLVAAHARAVKDHAGGDSGDAGFSYSLTPKGAVYPFSEVEVSCLVQASYSNRRGRKFCSDFFRIIETRLKTISSPEEK